MTLVDKSLQFRPERVAKSRGKSGIVWLPSELIRIAKNYQKTGQNFGERSLQLNYKGKEEQA
ncbi:MAG: hypothetical protein IM319_06025 [Microcystis sp. M113S1]|uniref:hypothetical protein n=1 Tax=Microcystis sp. M113S1 TaxID=2771104 RepID=UPI002586C76E|nr:hypothetical protein [Microcystis sp. M113S1]MCA2938739.1 hypothetical protein [Microcystis sp. M113S1]